MNILKNLFRQKPSNVKLPEFQKLSSDGYRTFIESNEFAVIFFDANWDVGGAKAIRPLLHSAVQTYGDRISIAEVDIDEVQDIPASISLRSIPALVYYRRGELVGIFTGPTQSVSERIESLLAGRALT